VARFEQLIEKEAVVRDVKKYTSVKIIGAIQNNQSESRRELLLRLFKRAGHHNSNNTQYQSWQQRNQAIELNRREVFDQRLDYIHHNPVLVGIVAILNSIFIAARETMRGCPITCLRLWRCEGMPV
jgi:hypothetical protein